VGNGRLLVCFDKDYRIRDLYFPHVGQENHLGGNPCRFGVFVDGRFSWVGEGWKRELGYEDDTLVTRVSLYHPELALLMSCRDVVDFHEDIYLREVTIENLLPKNRVVEFFFGQDFDISGNSIGDTAAHDPRSEGVVHYKGARYFLVNGMSGELGQGGGLSQFAVGVKKTDGKEGTFRDAEDGKLSGSAIAQGSVDSVVSLSTELAGHGSGKVYYWICAGQSWSDVRRLDEIVKQKRPENIIKRTADYWNLWLRKETPPTRILPSKVEWLYHRSLLILLTQIDWQGGILAANDSDVIQYNRDTYSYIWPRDGALVAHALDLAGYPEPARQFFRFAASVIEEEGYLLHKYNPDATLASSWHPWSDSGKPQLPIQEDETALVIWALWQHFVLYRDIELIKPLYRPLIKRAADFMAAYRHEETGLPDLSHDLWEERRSILSFTTGAVFGGLTAASLFCTVFGEEEKAREYRRVASEIRDAASKHLWREELGRFCRMAHPAADGRLEVDGTCDSSLWGLYAFGMYNADDPRVTATMAELRRKLWIGTPIGGMARYENDGYHRASPDVTGNPWFISTLWLADHMIRSSGGESEKELKEALEILVWAANHALPSGVLAEQLHPYTGEVLSVSPLTWSHATYITVAQRYLRRITDKAASISHRMDDWIGKLFAETCGDIHGACEIK
jgi:GH15 family glucan-1,4-alpha-glucosidase